VTLALKKKESLGGVLASWWIHMGLQLVAVVLLIKWFVGSPSGRSDYFYYQSSMYDYENCTLYFQWKNQKWVAKRAYSQTSLALWMASDCKILLPSTSCVNCPTVILIKSWKLWWNVFNSPCPTNSFREAVEEKLKGLHL
jgi:hypothetical protein